MTSHFYLQLVFRLLLHLRKYSGDERTSRLTASMQLLLLFLFVERGIALSLYKKRRRYNSNNNNTSTQKVKNITSKCNQYSLLHTTVNDTKMHEVRWVSFRCIRMNGIITNWAVNLIICLCMCPWEEESESYLIAFTIPWRGELNKFLGTR